MSRLLLSTASILLFAVVPRAWGQGPLKRNMTEIASTLQSLLILASEPKEFAGKERETSITENFERLARLFRENEAHFKVRDGDWRLNHKVTKELVQQARTSFRRGGKEIARQMVKSLPGMCMSCHSQDQLKATIFTGTLPATFSNLSHAEYLMATRRHAEAEAYLEKFLGARTGATSTEDLGQALRSELQIRVHLRRPWDEVRRGLERRRENFAQQVGVTSLLTGWLEGAKIAEKIFPRPLKHVKQVPLVLKAALGTAEPTLGLLADPKEEVVFLKLREDLHGLLAKKISSAEQGEVYYWLAFSERALGYNIFYSLADGYLRACMDEMPQLPVAKKCYREYEAFISFAYSGSAGTEIPADVATELRAYKKRVRY